MTARTDAQGRHERAPHTALELDLDYCSNTYGVSPCTAGRVNSGTLQSGGTTTVRLAAGASAVDDFYNNMTLRSTGGTGSGQEAKVIDYVGATRDATVSPAFSPALDGTTTYDVINRPGGCYNVFIGASPCQDQPNYVKGTKTVKFCTRGMPIPAGEQIRPYLARASNTPTQIDTAKGLAMRSQTSVTLTDEPARDDLDKYVEDRAMPAGGTFWPRLIARNPNAIGRFARLREGYAVTPWDWATFQTELYSIEAIKGPDGGGQFTVVLSDAVKLLDRSKIPAVTDGKLIADLAGASFTGTIVSATSTTAVLSEKALAVDDAYNGQELYILQNTGAGQRRVITDYVGETRRATLATWSVIPDSTSTCEVTPLTFTLPAGKGAQYTDPATSGKNEYIRIGDEVIRYTAKSTDTLSWTDGTYRAQFDTARDDHKAKDVVQLCRAWLDQPAKTVIEEILNEGGLADTYIDLTGLAQEDTDWLQAGRITACIADPETASELLADLLKDLNLMCWWHPVEQKVKFKADMPQIVSSVTALNDDKLMLGKTQVERLDAERITQAAVDFDLASATADRKKRTSYRTIEVYVDATAQGANSYGDVRPNLRASRWLTTANEVLARSNVARKLSRLRDAPSRIKFWLDPKDEIALGALADITSRKHVDAAGNAVSVRCRIVKVADMGSHFDLEARTTTFARRYGFICPNGYPDYPSATADQRQRAFISNGATMSDGTSAYLIS